MRSIIQEGILILYCFTTLLFIPADTAFVTAFLGAVIYVCVENMKLPVRYGRILPFLYLIFSCFFPKLLLFIPAVLYSVLETKHYMAAGVLGILCAFFYAGKDPSIFLFLAFGSIFACAFWYQGEQYERLLQEFKKTRDDGTELNIALKEKNRELLKNQDYEVYTATLKERNRIAREIHDNVGHILSRAILMAGAMRTVYKEEAVEGSLEQLEDTLHIAMKSVRESVHDLHDDSVNLKEVITGLVENYSFCPVHVKYDMGYSVPREVKYSFIAIVKEGLNNIAKHSHATKADIVMREHPGLYQLVIEDNGDGDGRSIPGDRAGEGIGIRNMKERVETLGGMMQITQEQGFRIYITVPKKGDI